MKTYLSLTKSGIVWFVLLSAIAGYAMSFPIGQLADWTHFFTLLIGLYLVSSGSFAFNQAQEWKLDARMPRTQGRPIPAGSISLTQAYILGVSFILIGLGLLALVSPLTAQLSAATVVLYNGIYTIYWKRHWSFGAVPGAIPGAMPVVIGYSANSALIFSPESVYLFFIMFLWQMPHFWCLAIRYKEDYAKGGVPVLPVQLGVYKTLYQMGLYTFVYVGLAIAAPWFFRANFIYLIVVVPMGIKVLYEFFKYFHSEGQKRWLPFFLWTNFSMLTFIAAPVIDKWVYNYLNMMPT